MPALAEAAQPVPRSDLARDVARPAGPRRLPAGLADRVPAAGRRLESAIISVASRIARAAQRRPSADPAAQSDGADRRAGRRRPAAARRRVLSAQLQRGAGPAQWSRRRHPRPGDDGQRVRAAHRVRRSRGGRRAAAQRQLGSGRRLGLPHRDAGDHRRRATGRRRVRRLRRASGRGSGWRCSRIAIPTPISELVVAVRRAPAGLPARRPRSRADRRPGALGGPARSPCRPDRRWSPGAVARR